MHKVMVVLALALSCGGNTAAPVKPVRTAPELDNVDVYGSATLDRDKLIARHGDAFVELLRAKDDAVGPLKKALEERLRGDGDFAYVGISMITYYDPKRTFATVDLVDTRDRARRMTFSPAPTGEHADPDGLIELWHEYEEKHFELLNAGTIDYKVKCPFWHCLGFGHADLKPYADRFAASVPTHEAELAAILADDKRDEWRASAAFLLAHLASGPRVVELMLAHVRDPDTLVRNNAMRVLALIAIDHADIAIPVAPIVSALAFPSTLDRNKAVAILSGLVKRPQLREEIRRTAGETLITLLALRQPNNHDFAYAILKELAGRDLGERDIAAWRTWLRQPH